jgi:hypothetical protein
MNQKTRGPNPERVKLKDADWRGAIKKALQKKRPAEGWPSEKKKAKKP